MVFFALNAIRISKVPEHYINRKKQYSTARTAVLLNPSYLSYTLCNQIKAKLLSSQRKYFSKSIIMFSVNMYFTLKKKVLILIKTIVSGEL